MSITYGQQTMNVGLNPQAPAEQPPVYASAPQSDVPSTKPLPLGFPVTMQAMQNVTPERKQDLERSAVEVALHHSLIQRGPDGQPLLAGADLIENWLDMGAAWIMDRSRREAALVRIRTGQQPVVVLITRMNGGGWEAPEPWQLVSHSK